MRIEAYTQVQQVYSAKKLSRANAAKNTGYSDKVQISGLGRDLQVAKAAVADSSDIRSEVIEPIKARVQAGTYDVSAGSFADKLLQKYEEMR